MNHLDILAIPIDEFFSHSTYSQIHYMNSYEYWNIKYAKYVIVAESNWIEQLSKEEKKFILTAQVQCKRGMTVPISFIHNIKDIPVDYIQNLPCGIATYNVGKSESIYKGEIIIKDGL